MKTIVITIHDPEEERREREYFKHIAEEERQRQREYDRQHTDAWREALERFGKSKP